MDLWFSAENTSEGRDKDTGEKLCVCNYTAEEKGDS